MARDPGPRRKPKPSRPRLQVAERERVVDPVVEALLKAPPVETPQPVLPELPPALPTLPTLTALPTLPPTLSLAATVTSLATRVKLPGLKLPGLKLLGRRLPGRRGKRWPGARQMTWEAREQALPMIRRIVVVPPPPVKPSRTLWWLPGWKYEESFTYGDGDGMRPGIWGRGDEVDIDYALSSMTSAGVLEFEPENVPAMWAVAVSSAREALVGYDELEWEEYRWESAGENDEDFEEVWRKITQRYVDLRADLWARPDQLKDASRFPLHRYDMIRAAFLWAGVYDFAQRGLDLAFILDQQDEPKASITGPLAALIDLVVWRYSIWLGSGGQEMDAWFDVVDVRPRERFPIDNFFFADIHQPAVITPEKASLRGRYVVASSTYVSGPGVRGDNIPWAVPGWRHNKLHPGGPPEHTCGVDCDNLMGCPKLGDLLDEPPSEIEPDCPCGNPGCAGCDRW